MNDSDKSSKIAGIVVVLLTVLLGVGYVHVNLENPRPPSAKEASEIPDPEDARRVESRLWQDPFEAFESATNSEAAAKVTSAELLDMLDGHLKPNRKPKNGCANAGTLWNDLTTNRNLTGVKTTILGVMLEGGPYAEDKEVRLRTRYAVEEALLVDEFSPADRTHIYTNSVQLTREGPGSHSRNSRYAYEWFDFDSPRFKSQICVLWLDEDDFADSPALRLGSLLVQIPPLTKTNGNAAFYLIGPRASDTLRALASMDTNSDASNYRSLTNAAESGNFQILSPEATACVDQTNTGDNDDGIVKAELARVLGADVFHNWIASDQQIASLISQELANRVNQQPLNADNVVVLLSEQDTYYGRKLADEWTSALASQVCADATHVWQYAYLRGLDGSKPQSRSEKSPPATTTGSEGAVPSQIQQQQEGDLADGDAQMDYVDRLGEFLQEKDEELKRHTHGRIVAFGLDGSDTYDKLILLQALRPKFPEAVFFTTDLDGSLWTTKELKYTRGLLVGSAYPLNPSLTISNTQNTTTEMFAPFRDVYETAIFRSCTRVVDKAQGDDSASLDADQTALDGGLYTIGWHGPVRLSTDADSVPEPAVNGLNPGWPMMLMTVTAFGWILLFFAGANVGVRMKKPDDWRDDETDKVEMAEKRERDRQIPLRWLLAAVGTIPAIGLMAWIFQCSAAATANHAWEEPWVFTSGVSIWPSECLRMLAVVGAILFFMVASYRRRRHRQKLWEEFFRDEADEPGKQPLKWGKFFKHCRKRWGHLSRKARQKITEIDAYRIWERGGKPEGKREAHWRQAESELDRERKVTLIKGWMPPFIEVKHDGQAEAAVNATALFKCYLHLGMGRRRVLRASMGVALYAALAGIMIYGLRDVPTFLLIRGPLSHFFDKVILCLSVLATLFTLFYIFDSGLLTKRILDHLNRHPTCWPDPPLFRCAARFGIKPRHLDSLLDVEFAAVQTAEIGPLMFGPLALILILLISRCSYFDNWTWPAGLIGIFVLNFLLVVFCWWMVRRATEKVRKDAIERLELIRLWVKNSKSETYDIPAQETAGASATVPVDKAQYLKNLKAVISRIKEEKRGAFAVWFQDPAYLAVGVPSGLTGIIGLILSYLQNR